MRNRAKTNREWTKTFRFNGHDYILSSVFDDEEHDLFDIENYVGESYLQLQKQKSLNESFLRDIDDEDIADSLGLTKTRIQQIRRAALAQMKNL